MGGILGFLCIPECIVGSKVYSKFVTLLLVISVIDSNSVFTESKLHGKQRLIHNREPVDDLSNAIERHSHLEVFLEKYFAHRPHLFNSSFTPSNKVI